MGCHCNSSICNKLKCGCADHSLTTPCVYSECRTSTAEQCEDIQCAECVSYCGETFSVDVGSNTFMIETGTRLNEILQNIALFIKDPSCVDTAATLIYITSVTSTTVTLVWSGLPPAAAVDLEYKTVASGGWSTAASAIPAGTVSHEVTLLAPNTDYMFRIANGNCESVEIYATTLTI